MKKSYIIWILAPLVVASGLWADFHTIDGMIPVSYFTIPYAVFLLIMGIIYLFLELKLKKGIIYTLLLFFIAYTALYSMFLCVFCITRGYKVGNIVNSVTFLYSLLIIQVIVILMAILPHIIIFFKNIYKK